MFWVVWFGVQGRRANGRGLLNCVKLRHKQTRNRGSALGTFFLPVWVQEILALQPWVLQSP